MNNEFIGKQFDDMLVLRLDHITKNHVKVYEVECQICGNKKLIQQSRLKRLETTSHTNKGCGVYISEYDNNINSVIDDITIIKLHSITNNGYKYVTRCNVCGLEHDNLISNIKKHHGTLHKKCGLLIKKDKYIKRFKKIWNCMRYRTTCSKYTEWHLYGGRGINSNYFEDFMVFYETMFESYVEHVEKFGEKETSLDRIDCNGNYEPSNCRWATSKEQANNTRKVKRPSNLE